MFLDNIPTFLVAFAGGLFPALIWLWFFLKEDKKNPEPRLLIILAFLAGMLAVLISLVLEHLSGAWGLVGLPLILLWAFIEEGVKFAMAGVTVLWRTQDDEPIDPVIYMITVALGFAALETSLFLLGPLLERDIPSAIINGNLRFLGAALLHVISSAAVGIALAFAFYRPLAVKIRYGAIGLLVATVLHAFFNFFIIEFNGRAAMVVFFIVWIAVIVLLLLFEKVKRIYKPLLVIKRNQ